MELPAEVLVHNPVLGLKGGRATLLRISDEGYFELNLKFGENVHRAMLPVQGTVIIQREPEPQIEEAEFEIER